MFSDHLKGFARSLLGPLVRGLARTRLTPNAVSLLGFLITAAIAVVIALGQLPWGGLLILITAPLDMLDGQLARLTGRTTKFGAFLDSTLDRYSEAVLLFGLMIYDLRLGAALDVGLILAVLVGSLMVSYVRARAEAIGVNCEVGWFARPERIVLFALGLIGTLVFPWSMQAVLWAMAVLTHFTVLQRIWHVRQQTLAPPPEAGPDPNGAASNGQEPRPSRRRLLGRAGS